MGSFSIGVYELYLNKIHPVSTVKQNFSSQYSKNILEKVRHDISCEDNSHEISSLIFFWKQTIVTDFIFNFYFIYINNNTKYYNKTHLKWKLYTRNTNGSQKKVIVTFFSENLLPKNITITITTGLIQQMINWLYSYIFQKAGFDSSCILSPLETICINCQILFSGKQKKDISARRLLKILPRVLSVNGTFKLMAYITYIYANDIESKSSIQIGILLPQSPLAGRKKIVKKRSAPRGMAVSRQFESQCQKTYLRTCVLSEDSDQTAHSRSLIWIFTWRFLDSQGCKVSSCGQRRHWSDCTEADLSLRWAKMS